MVKAIFFDAAGTLIFLPRPVGEHYADVARRFGAEVSPEALQAAFRRAWAASPPRAASAGPRPEDDKGWWRHLVGQVLGETLTATQKASFPEAEYFEAVYAHFAEPGVWELFPEVAELLAGLRRRGFRLGVISNFDQRLETILAGLDVRHFFDCVILSSQVGADKPGPRIFRSGLQALEVEAAEAVHAGDDPQRDGGAEAIGMRVFHLDRPRTTLNALPGWIDALAGPEQEDLPRCGGGAK